MSKQKPAKQSAPKNGTAPRARRFPADAEILKQWNVPIPMVPTLAKQYGVEPGVIEAAIGRCLLVEWRAGDSIKTIALRYNDEYWKEIERLLAAGAGCKSFAELVAREKPTPADPDAGAVRLQNGVFGGGKSVYVGAAHEFEVFRTTKGALYRRALPTERADAIYELTTPGLPALRLVEYDDPDGSIEALFAAKPEAEQRLVAPSLKDGAAKAPGADASKAAALARAPKGKSKKPVRGLAK